MFDASSSDLATLDRTLEPLLARARERSADTEQLAMDATRLLSVRPEQLGIVANQPFFKRAWRGLTGQTLDQMAASQNPLFEMQRLGWRYLQLLNERDLMLAHTMIAVKNNLLTLAVKETETRQMLTAMANRIADRFVALEERVETIEIQQNLHAWLLTLETYDYPDRYPAKLRMLRVIQDFFTLKSAAWSLTEIKYLQKALKEVDLPWREEITLADFIEGLIDEIDDQGFEVYARLVELSGPQGRVEHRFILDNISAPSHKALYKIAESYAPSCDTIDLLVDHLAVSRRDALKRVLRGFIEKEGIDTSVTVTLRDLAVELLGCHGLVLGLLGAVGEPTKTDAGADGARQSASTNHQENTTTADQEKQTPQINQNRYRDLNDGTVLDTETGLQWMRCALGQDSGDGKTCRRKEGSQLNWYEAQEAAKQLNFRGYAGYRDWRVPSLEELKTIVVEGTRPSIDHKAFLGTLERHFWSSSADTNSGNARYVYFGTGKSGSFNQINGNFCVRLVRG
ncbi:DUF1566 domain-containing protein [uncultured Thiocystis sp.]|jgi:hypothetical protein|uniref:Lcl C-terminal domain-containing protein n=1 Tax=uncultured Thiocystis sp. TaxID=1202134 RepID=UPI0025DED76C|nr:DUF1566 domain-containing protein [uncultured Thiocystis sp.]